MTCNNSGTQEYCYDIVPNQIACTERACDAFINITTAIMDMHCDKKKSLAPRCERLLFRLFK